HGLARELLGRLPPGNDTVNVTTGTLQGLSQQGNILIRSVKLYVPPALALNLHPPTLVETIPVQAAPVSGIVYWNVANNTTFVPTTDRLIPGAQVVLWGPNGLTPQRATTDADGSFDLSTVPPGVYNYNVLVDGQNYSQSQVFVHPNSPTTASAGLVGGEITGNVTQGKSPIGGVRVSLGNASGTFDSVFTNVTGQYSFTGLAPGNYTLTASGPAPTDQIPGQTVVVPAHGGTIRVPLVVQTGGQATVVVTASGSGTPGISVRFVPLPNFLNGTVSPVMAIQDADRNGTTAVTGPGGSATVTLPIGNYSVYALGYVGGSLESALGSVAVLPSGVSTGITPIALQPSALLSGTVANAGVGFNSSGAAVLVYGSGLSEVTAWTNLTRGYSVVLPLGTYSVLALDGPATGGATVYAALAQTTVRYPTTLNLAPFPSISTRFLVGTPLADGTFFPAAAATVSITAGLNGPGVTTLAGSDGTVATILPAQLPLSAGSYCVAVASAGFEPVTDCGYSPTGLTSLSHVDLAFTPVPVTLRVLGLPAGTSVTINLSATSASGTTHNLTGGPDFSFTTTPGQYTLSARAVIGNGTLVYIPSQILRTEIPLGAASSTLTLVVVPSVNATGALT
ncbi:Collagen-binding surface protein Cna-like, B region domain protein, partial [mine drainage metagenome]